MSSIAHSMSKRTSSILPNGESGTNQIKSPWLAGSNMFSTSTFSTCAWNARALDHHDARLRKGKVNELISLCKRFDIIFVSEVHGSLASLKVMLKHCTRSHQLFHSPCIGDSGPLKDTGGTMFLVSHQFTNVKVQEIVSGRLMELMIHEPEGIRCIAGCHNYGLDSATMVRVSSFCDNHMSRARNSPDKYAFMLIGDLNIEADSDETFSLVSPKFQSKVCQNSASNVAVSNTALKSWKAIFAKMTEVVFPSPSHFYSGGNKMTRINRILIFCPKSCLPLLRIEAGIVNDPLWYESRGFSDHSPIFIIFGSRNPLKKRDNLRIKPEWCKHRSYNHRLERLCMFYNLSEMDIDERSRTLKTLMRDGATYARDQMLIEKPYSSENLLLRLGSIARCIWHGDMALYNCLLNKSDESGKKIYAE